MKGARVHIPPSERRRRIVTVIPFLLGVAVFVILISNPPRHGEYDGLYFRFLLTAWLAVGASPLVGLALWMVSPSRKFRARRAATSEEGLIVRGLVGSRTVPWSRFESFRLARVGDTSFGVLTLHGTGASWIVEASGDGREALSQAMHGRAEGVARFFYEPSEREGGLPAVWTIFGVCVGCLSAAQVLDPWSTGCLLIPLYPIHTLVSFFLLVRLLLYPAYAALQVDGAGRGCSFRVRRGALPGVPADIRGRTDIYVASGAGGCRYALLGGSLSREKQARLIGALLPPDEAAGEPASKNEE